jgi:hypothetical protein
MQMLKQQQHHKMKQLVIGSDKRRSFILTDADDLAV